MKKATGFVEGIIFTAWTLTVLTVGFVSGQDKGFKDARKKFDDAVEYLKKKYDKSSEEKKEEEAGA